jgi:hypothetical protein
MSPVIRKRRIGPVILTAGLRRDGNHSWSVADDHRDGGPVIVAITTPWVVVAIFDGPRLEAYADTLS